MDPATANILGVVMQIVIAVVTIASFVAIPLGIVLLITALTEKVNLKKRHTRIMWGIISIVAPIIILFVTLSLWGLVRILTNTVGA